MTMDTVNGKSNAPSGENQNASDVSAEMPTRTPLQQRIETQRTQLLQAYSVLVCLYEVLLHAEGDDAVVYAEAAHVAANLINNTVEQLDSVHIGRLSEA
jgi:streptomycin 6-kinase